MAKKWVTIEAGSLSAGDKTYRAGTHEIDTDSDRGKAVLEAANDYSWVKVHDEEPRNSVFSDQQVDYLRKMFPQYLELATAHQKLQAEYERLQAEKIAAAGPGANPDTMGVLTSADTAAARKAHVGIGDTAPAEDFDPRKGDDATAPSVQPDYDAVKAEVQLAGADDEAAAYSAGRQASGVTVSDDAPDAKKEEARATGAAKKDDSK